MPQKESVISASVWQNLCLHYPREFPLSILSSVNFIAGSVNSGTIVKTLVHFRLYFPEEAESFSLHRDKFSRLVVISFLGKLLISIYTLIHSYATLSRKLKARARNCI